MASRVFTKHQFGIAPANGLRGHYFVRQAVFEHTILVDARFMSKGVRPDDSFIGLHGDTRQLTDQLAGRKKLLRTDTSADVPKGFWSGTESHDDFFHGRITRALTKAIDGYLNLSRASFNGGKSIGSAHTQVVVTMSAHDYLIDTRDTFQQITEE